MFRALAWAIVGYFAGAFGGGLLVLMLTSNTHDASVEAAMTGAFLTGPSTAIIAGVVGFFRRRR